MATFKRQVLVNYTKALKIDTFKILKSILQKEWIQDRIIKLNREVQLFKKGETSGGKKLATDFARGQNVYADFTIDVKSKKGQPTDRVTLKSSGGFYESFDIEIRNTFAKMVADFKKPGGEDISENFQAMFDRKEFQEAVLGLSKDSLKLLANKDEVLFDEFARACADALSSANEKFRKEAG